MDSFKSTWRGQTLRLFFRDGRLRTMASQALQGPRPIDSRDWLHNPAIVELGGRYASWLLSPPYWESQVDRALLAALLLGCAAFAIFLGWMPIEAMLGVNAALWVPATLGVLTIVSLVHALKSHGPAEPISPRSYVDAWSRLRVATDDQVSSRSLVKSLVLVFLLLVDGAVLGVAMAKSLGAFLTPQLAKYVAVAWGLASAIMIWKLAVLAAEEMRENGGRATIRRLDASSKPEDRENARKFMANVGSRIGHDLSTKAPIKKRVALFAVALLLAAASVGLRVAGGHAPSSAPIPLAALQSDLMSVAMSAGPEIEVPPAVPPQAEEGAVDVTPSENTSITTWLGALVLAAVVVISAITLLWTLAQSECIDRINSPRDRAVVERFDSPNAVEAFNRTHLQNVTSALESRLQRFAREVELAKQSLSPSEARTWPPIEVRATDVLAAALRPLGSSTGLINS